MGLTPIGQMIGSTVTSAVLTAVRAHQQAVTLDEGATCVIHTVPVGAPVLDPVTRTYSDQAGDVVYAGPCRVVRAGIGDGRLAQVPGDQVSMSQVDVQIPAAIAPAGILPDQRVTVADPTTPWLDGRVLRITRVIAGSDSPAIRILCDDDQG